MHAVLRVIFVLAVHLLVYEEATMMMLRDSLYALLTGAFAVGPAIYLACEHVPFFAKQNSIRKRWIVAGASSVLGLAVWGVALWLGYVRPPPAYSVEYVANGVWSYGILVACSAFVSATLLHGHLTMMKED
jgi:hypothetical protein